MKRIVLFLALAAAISCSCSDGKEKMTASRGNGGRSSAVVISPEAIPALADSLTNALVYNFLDKTTGTFWGTPNDQEHNSQNLYWQQAHALDVLLYCAARVKETDPNRSALYLDYADKWYRNYAHNYNATHRGEGTYGGFFNDWTDDMAWIGLTLMNISEISGNSKYADTARQVYDNYIWPRRVNSAKGIGLPWTNHAEDQTNLNACTNAPSCLLAARLYLRYGSASYLDNAKTLYAYNIANMPDEDRVENPALTYTQGTFGEACRVLYHITGEPAYMDKAARVIRYAFTGSACTHNGIPRHEGTNMDQSLFKAVLIPYAVNFVLDSDAPEHAAATVREKLMYCATVLNRNLDKKSYPRMYATYYWGEMHNPSQTASMGAQASGASLLEGVSRLVLAGN